MTNLGTAAMGVEYSPEPTAEWLLEWMGCHHLPLELFREEETDLWVVVDSAAGAVLSSAETPLGALRGAQTKEASTDAKS